MTFPESCKKRSIADVQSGNGHSTVTNYLHFELICFSEISNFTFEVMFYKIIVMWSICSECRTSPQMKIFLYFLMCLPVPVFQSCCIRSLLASSSLVPYYPTLHNLVIVILSSRVNKLAMVYWQLNSNIIPFLGWILHDIMMLFREGYLVGKQSDKCFALDQHHHNFGLIRSGNLCMS